MPKEQAVQQKRTSSVGTLQRLVDQINNLTHPNDMPRRIEACEAAVALVERNTQPELWASLQVQLASSLSENPLGDRAANQEQAIQHYQLAIEILSRQDFPVEWAAIQNDLGTVYQKRIQEHRPENLEQAIEHYLLALEIRSRQDFPEEWAMSQHYLANAWIERIRGDKAQNLEKAITHFNLALEIYTRQAFPYEWARTQNDLATAYRNRIRGDQAENIEKAIYHSHCALEIYTRQEYAEDWARCQNNLAATYVAKIDQNREQNLEQAIHHYKRALEIYSRPDFEYEWALVQGNLGEAYCSRIRGDKKENIEQAIVHGQLALEILSPQAFPYDWAWNQKQLAVAYANRIEGKRPENIKQAIAHYRKALDIQLPEAWPHDCRDTAYELGHLLYDEKRYSEARDAFESAHQAVDILRGEMEVETSKQKLSSENADLYAHLVHCCFLMKDPRAAFEYAVKAKGRAFVDILAAESFDLAALSESNPAFAQDLAKARQLRQQIDETYHILHQARDKSSLSDRIQQYKKIQQLEEQETGLWDEMTFKYPALTATQSVPPITTREACQLAVDLDSTLVEYYRHQGGWCAFVVTPDQVEDVKYVALDSLDDKIKRMKKWTKGLELRSGSGRAPWFLSELDKWYQAVYAPLEAYLPSNKLTLAPFGDLHLLPIAAARSPEGRYLSEECTLTFAPSLSALHVAWQAYQASHASGPALPQPLLTVAYPGIKGQKEYLENVLLEAKAIANHFPQQVKLLQEDNATPNAVIAQAPKRHVIHFGCHGDFNRRNPKQSGLMLAGGHLTVNRIITELKLEQANLVTLAACRTGQVAIRQGEEHVGLQQAVMTAGARAVVGSLWVVSDEATRHLFESFYGEIAKQRSPAEAMVSAAQAVQQRGKTHPYYWAAFPVSGLAHQPFLSGLTPQPIDKSVEAEISRQYQMRGVKAMDAEELMESSYKIVEGLTDYPNQILALLAKEQQADVVQTIGQLSEQASEIHDGYGLSKIVKALHDLAGEIPGALDPGYKKRLTLESVEKVLSQEKQKRYVQEQIPQMEQSLNEAHEKLKEAVKKACPDEGRVDNKGE